jgi:very-short-patch-repair endonuclease
MYASRMELQTWSERLRHSVQASAMHRTRSPLEAISAMPLELSDEDEPGSAELHRTALRLGITRMVSFCSCDLEIGAMQCGSPIERAMFYALWIAAWDYEDGIGVRVGGHLYGGYGNDVQSFALEIEPQAALDPYRVDFLLTYGNGPENRTPLVIECDGHAFHERTKQQASRDRARDRDLQSRGYPVFRYTGSDIWRDVFTHAHQALDLFYANDQPL